MYLVTAPLSLTGLVLAMQATAVNPPASAARVPVRTVSLYSCPGSRRCTCMSMRPGTTQQPPASTRSSAGPASPGAVTRATRPSTISTSNAPWRALAGSTTVPPLIRSDGMSARLPPQTRRRRVLDLGRRHLDRRCVGHRLAGAIGEQEERRHAHRDAV